MLDDVGRSTAYIEPYLLGLRAFIGARREIGAIFSIRRNATSSGLIPGRACEVGRWQSRFHNEKSLSRTKTALGDKAGTRTGDGCLSKDNRRLA